MVKLYKRIFSSFILFIVIINIASFMAGFNKKQLRNFFFYSERTVAVYYIAKHIVFESGVYLKQTSPILLSEAINSAATAYGIDPELLRKLTISENEFSIAMPGGMGLTSITPSMFRTSGLSDPYNFKENIFAAAHAIKQLQDSGAPNNKLIKRFLLSGTDSDTLKVLAPSYFANIQTISAESH